MKILAVNTATVHLSIALVQDEETLYLFETRETRGQDNKVLHHIHEGLQQNGLAYEDLDLFAVVTGPGSFTGIRVSIAAMQGLSLATGKPLIGVSSFELFAIEDQNCLIAMESWREELYCQLILDHQAALTVNLSPEECAQQVFPLIEGRSVCLAGDAAQKMAEFLPTLPMGTHFEKNAVKVAKVAARKLGSNNEPVRPFYLREADVTIKKRT